MKLSKIILSEVKKFVTENNITNKIWYHGSNKPVEKFLFSLIEKNSEKISNYHGYGIYFIDDIERAKGYGNIITSVKIDQNSDILYDKITLEQLQKIIKGLEFDGFDAKDFNIDSYDDPAYGEYGILSDVEEFYDFLKRRFKLKNIKEVSELLLRSGIDGMKVTNDVNDNILVVFNEDIINIITNP